MAEMKESSVLFSLNQLMTLEQQRVREEQEAAVRRAQAERAARLEAERRAQQEEAARLRAEEERRRTEEARRREENARLEAIRQAEIERARVEAEQRARIEAMEHQRRHERELASLAHDAHKRRLQRMLAVSAVSGVVLLGATLGVYFGKIKPDAEKAQAEQAAARAAQEARLDQLRGDLAQRNKQIDELVEALRAERSQAERAALERQIDDVKRKRDAIQRKVTTALASGQSGPCTCQQGDPMCGCLP